MTKDIQLINRAKKGDNKAFEELVMKYDRLVLNIAFSYRNNKDDADDIYQEVFLRVHRGLRNFQSRSKFSTWLYRITINVCIEFKRKAKIRDHEPLNNYNDENENSFSYSNVIESEEKTDQPTLVNETAYLIKNELEKLPKQLKMAFTLKYYQGFKIKEISEMMNCTEGTVKSYLFTSSRKIRANLKPILEM